MRPQDVVITRRKSPIANSDPLLKAVGREHFGYSLRVNNVGATGGQWAESFSVVDSNIFWISNFSAVSFVSATQAVNTLRAGALTVRDDSTQYNIMENVELRFVSQGADRLIYPISYPILNGGSFTIILDVTALAGATTQDIFVNVEGFKDYVS